MKAVVLSTRKGHIVSHYPRSLAFDPVGVLKKALVSKNIMPFNGCFVGDQKKTFFVQKRRMPALWLWHIAECDIFQSIHMQKERTKHYPYPVCITCKKGLLMWANDTMQSFLGLSLHQIYHQYFNDLIVHVSHPASERVYALANQQKEGPFIQIKHVDQTRDLVVFYFTFLDQHKKNTGHIIDQLSVPCALIDKKGQFLRANSSFSLYFNEYTQRHLEQWAGRAVHDKIVSHFHALSHSNQKKALATSAFPINSHGHFVALSSFYHPEKSDAFLCFFGIHPDDPVSGKHSEKMQMVGQLASGIVHDFNNLLTGILGFCDLLLQRHQPQEMSFQDISQIKQSALRASSLIQKLLHFSKSTPLPPSSFSLKKCLHNLLPLIQRVVGPKIVSSIRCEGQDHFSIHADFVQVEQMILNLAINARDAMKDGGDLVFCIEKKDIKEPYPVVKGHIDPQTYVVLTIKDTGTGIDPKNIDRIFDSFFSTKGSGQGTGLGLSNILESIQEIKGGIKVQSQKGVGTSFTLFFPESTVPTNKTTFQPMHNSMDQCISKKMTIILVEDEDAVRLFASRALRDHGHHVIEMRDGMQAVQWLDNHHDVDMIITDVMMHGMDGPTLAQHFYQTIPSIRILFVSGYPEEKVRCSLSTNMPDVYFLAKPFSLKDLVDKVHQIRSHC